MSISPSPAAQTLAQNGLSAAAPTQGVSPTGQNINTSIQTASAQPSEAAQQTLIQALAAQAAGKGGPTVAQQQLTAGTNANLASTLAATAASNRAGQNTGANARTAQTVMANANTTGAGQAAQLRAGEIQSAQTGLASAAGTMTAQQLQEAQAQESANQTGAEFGATQGQQAAEFGAGSANQASLQRAGELGALTNTIQAGELVPYEAAINPSSYIGPLSGASSSALGAATANSDEAVKQNISNESVTSQQFLSALSSYVSGSNGGGIAPPSPAAQNYTTNINQSKPAPAPAPTTGAQEAGYAGDIGATPVNSPTGAVGNDNLNLMPDPLGDVSSDEDTKQNVTSDAEGSNELLEGMEGASHGYEYKDPSMPGSAEGRHYGPMAQELEASGPIGQSVVNEGPDGVKRVDTGRLALALASASGVLNSRMDRLEAALKAGSVKSDDEEK